MIDLFSLYTCRSLPFCFHLHPSFAACSDVLGAGVQRRAPCSAQEILKLRPKTPKNPPQGSLDAVHAGAALHCWPSPSAGLAEISRVLRPGGVFVASTFLTPVAPLGEVLGDAAVEPFSQAVSQRTNQMRFWSEPELRRADTADTLTDTRIHSPRTRPCSSPAGREHGGSGAERNVACREHRSRRRRMNSLPTTQGRVLDGGLVRVRAEARAAIHFVPGVQEVRRRRRAGGPLREARAAVERRRAEGTGNGR